MEKVLAMSAKSAVKTTTALFRTKKVKRHKKGLNWSGKTKKKDSKWSDGEQEKTFGECYESKEKLGAGSYGKVFLAFKKDKDLQVPFAVKEIRKAGLNSSSLQQLDDEVNALSKLGHPNIIEFFEKFDEQDRVYIVMEYVTGGNLAQMLQQKRGYSEPLVKKYIFQITAALQHCKDMGVVHRDIKPANVLVTGDVNNNPLVKLLDFGFSAIVDVKVNDLEDKVLDKWCGTAAYASPEIINKHTYNFKTDFWSLGVVMFELLSGGTKPFPFNPSVKGAQNRMMDKIVTNDYDFLPEHVWRHISDDAIDLIKHLLVIDQDERFGPEETFGHKWLESEVKANKSRILGKTNSLLASGKTSEAPQTEGGDQLSDSQVERKMKGKVRGVIMFNQALNVFEGLMGPPEEEEEEQRDDETDLFRRLKHSPKNVCGSQSFGMIDMSFRL